MKYLLFVIAFATGCGGNYNVSVSGTVKIQPDLSELVSFFQQECAKQLGPDATQSQIDTCVNTSVQNFLNTIESISGGK